MIEVIQLDESQIDVAAGVLANAFQDDPLSIYMLPDPAERAKKLPIHFRPIVRYGMLFGEVLTTPLMEGVAVWTAPDLWEVTPERAVQAGFDQLPSLIGDEPLNRFNQANDNISTLHVRDVPRDHWYLMVIGIDPAKQGRGIGRALIEAILKRADEDGLPCYLETCVHANATFYARLGFQQLINAEEPSSQLPFWTFLYDPINNSIPPT